MEATIDKEGKVFYDIDEEPFKICGVFRKNDGSVDRCHPNDFGFASMAKALIEVMENIKITN